MVVIVFDLETSGLNPYHDDIIEIGAKVLNEDNSFQKLVKPKSNRPISKKITQITGITNKILREEGFDWLNAYSEFFNWFIECTKDNDNISIVSHNGDTFDFVFLKRMFKDLTNEGTDTSMLNTDKIHFHDTLPLTKRLYPNRTYYNQPSLAKTFNILLIDAHRAMGDVLVLEQLYTKILGDLNKLENIDGLNNPNLIRDYINLKI
jgi:DNA polymerase III subunit alpha, Gram-positive type